MKAILEFNLPEEFEEHQQALHAGAVLSRLDDLDNELRRFTKYGSREILGIVVQDTNSMDTVEELVQAIRSRLSDIQDRG